jgi:hypothetical protein
VDHLETAALACCVYEAITARERAGREVPEYMRALERKLEAEVYWHAELLQIAEDLVDVPELSRAGHRIASGGAELGQEKKITAAEAALILGCSKRQVTRIGSDLDGEIVHGQWLFLETTVLEYQEAKERHGHGDESPRSGRPPGRRTAIHPAREGVAG